VLQTISVSPLELSELNDEDTGLAQDRGWLLSELATAFYQANTRRKTGRQNRARATQNSEATVTGAELSILLRSLQGNASF
jgi:hypothetical protein